MKSGNSRPDGKQPGAGLSFGVAQAGQVEGVRRAGPGNGLRHQPPGGGPGLVRILVHGRSQPDDQDLARAQGLPRVRRYCGGTRMGRLLVLLGALSRGGDIP